jgi:hypothetical protein
MDEYLHSLLVMNRPYTEVTRVAVVKGKGVVLAGRSSG